MRSLLMALAVLVVGVTALPNGAGADVRAVNCGRGKKIANALRLPAARALTINVSGACTENLTIVRDDVTIQGDGTATLAPADSARPTIRIEGGRRIVIKGLTITGGAGAVEGVDGSLFSVVGTTATPCLVRDGTRYGVLASWNSTGTIDRCTIQGVGGDGVAASNSSSIAVTSSTVQDNTGNGIVAARNSHARIGQNRNGDAAAQPVTITGNDQHGVSIVDGSAGIVVGGTVAASGTDADRRHGIFVGRGSAAQIGTGVGGLEAGVTINGNTGDGIYVEGGHVTVLGCTISANRTGVVLTNGASGRIGIRSDSSAYVGNEITANRAYGMTIAAGANGQLGGNNIHDNGTDTTSAQRFGVVITRATATLIGGNTISGHWNSGMLIWPGVVRIGDSSYGLPSENTISGNGLAGPSGLGMLGGILVGLGGSADIRGATISENVGRGIGVWDSGSIDLRDGAVVSRNVAASGQTGDLGDAGHGVTAFRNSAVRLRATASVTENAGSGIFLSGESSAQFDSSSATVRGNTFYGVRCIPSSNYFSGNLHGVTGNTAGGNDDGSDTPNTISQPSWTLPGNIPGCTRF